MPGNPRPRPINSMQTLQQQNAAQLPRAIKNKAMTSGESSAVSFSSPLAEKGSRLYKKAAGEWRHPNANAFANSELKNDSPLRARTVARLYISSQAAESKTKPQADGKAESETAAEKTAAAFAKRTEGMRQ